MDTAESRQGVTSGPGPAPPQSPQVIAKAGLLGGQVTSQALIP